MALTTCLVVATPLGPFRLVATASALVATWWQPAAEPVVATSQPVSALLEDAAAQLAAYFAGALTRFSVPLAPVGPAFDQRVWPVLGQIGHGQTRTYGALAAELGTSARAIGGACARNPLPLFIPCHRVVAANGPGGFSARGGVVTKQVLLRLEAMPLEVAGLPLFGPTQTKVDP